MKKYLFIICMIVLLSLGTLYYVKQPSEFERFITDFGYEIKEEELWFIEETYYPRTDGYYKEGEARYRQHYYSFDGELVLVGIIRREDDYYSLQYIYFKNEDGTHWLNTRELREKKRQIEDFDMSRFDPEEVVEYIKREFGIE